MKDLNPQRRVGARAFPFNDCSRHPALRRMPAILASLLVTEQWRVESWRISRLQLNFAVTFTVARKCRF